jgi:hypothetical protein
VAKWDGSNWSNLGSGVDGIVYVLDVGSLWVGGEFTRAGRKLASSIAKWDGPMGDAPEVSMSVLLEGPYTGSGQMSAALNPQLPANQPFDSPRWHYFGTESVSGMPASAVDWLLMELRSDSTAASMFGRQAILLLDDGSIVDTAGAAPSFWGVPDDSVWVVLHSRNHLPIMTHEKIKIVDGVWAHDFRPAANTAYSRSSAPMKQLSDGPYGMFAGDANADGFVQALDFNAYLAQTMAGASGYQTADFNLDGDVQALDFNLYLANTLLGATSQVP